LPALPLSECSLASLCRSHGLRLRHVQAAYHANRAAVALQLGNFAGAAADAEQAVQLCPDHSAARLRAARALVAMHTPEARTRPHARSLH
jgi:regulator of sirC expression with transglutaminase-like and TPR domain